MKNNIKFEEINVNNPEFNEAIEIYNESFPDKEKRPLEDLKNNIMETEKLFIGKYNGITIMLSIIWEIENTDYLFLDYIAVKKEYRNKRIGTEFLKNIFKIFKNYNNIIFEVENPKEGTNKAQRIRRINFYRKLGAQELTGFKYFLPPRNGKSEQMVLMMLSNNTDMFVDGKEIENILSLIYKHIYHREEDDTILKNIVDDIPEKIHLK